MPTCLIPEGYVHRFCVVTCLTGVWPVLAYSIPMGYVHKWPWCSDSRGSPG